MRINSIIKKNKNEENINQFLINLIKKIYSTVLPLFILIFFLIALFLISFGILEIQLGSLFKNLIITSGFILLISSLFLYFLLMSNTKKIWFYTTVLLMFTIFFIGFFALHLYIKENFITNLGILFSVILFSLPMGMESLRNLYTNNKK